MAQENPAKRAKFARRLLDLVEVKNLLRDRMEQGTLFVQCRIVHNGETVVRVVRVGEVTSEPEPEKLLEAFALCETAAALLLDSETDSYLHDYLHSANHEDPVKLFGPCAGQFNTLMHPITIVNYDRASARDAIVVGVPLTDSDDEDEEGEDEGDEDLTVAPAQVDPDKE